MSTFTDLEKDAASVDGFVNENGLIPTRRNGPKPSYQYLVDGWNAEIDATILELNKSRGFRVVGTFADGFTYELFNDVGIDADGNSWIYVGAGAPNKVVPAGTVPSVGAGYEQVTFNSLQSDSVTVGDGSLSDRLKATQIKFPSVSDLSSGVQVGGKSLSVDDLQQLNQGSMTVSTISFYDGWATSTRKPTGGAEYSILTTAQKEGSSYSGTEGYACFEISISGTPSGYWACLVVDNDVLLSKLGARTGNGYSELNTNSVYAAWDIGSNVIIPRGVYYFNNIIFRPFRHILAEVDYLSTMYSDNTSGNFIDMNDVTHCGISGVALSGVGETALGVYDMQNSYVKTVKVVGSFVDGFSFDLMYTNEISELYTNGAVITNSCFTFKGEINGTNFSSLQTSNGDCRYNFYIDGDGHGNTFNSLVAQGGDYGLYAKKILVGGWTINGFYSENVAFPIRLGDKSSNSIVSSIVFNAPYISGAFSRHRLYSKRLYAVLFDNATSAKLVTPYFAGQNGVNATKVTITGDGTGARAYAYTNPDGTVADIILLSGGSGYTSATVSISGIGGGATATATVDSEIQEVTGVTLTNSGSGYRAEQTPILVMYNYAINCSIDYPRAAQAFNPLPLFASMYRVDGGLGISGVSVNGCSAFNSGVLATAELIKPAVSIPSRHILKICDADGTEIIKPIDIGKHPLPDDSVQ